MHHTRRQTRPEDHEFDLLWWRVPGVLALLVLAAVLAEPSLDRRNALREATAAPGVTATVHIATAAAVGNLAQAQAPAASVASAK